MAHSQEDGAQQCQCNFLKTQKSDQVAKKCHSVLTKWAAILNSEFVLHVVVYHELRKYSIFQGVMEDTGS